jgi:hypothetical protein
VAGELYNIKLNLNFGKLAKIGENWRKFGDLALGEEGEGREGSKETRGLRKRKPNLQNKKRGRGEKGGNYQSPVEVDCLIHTSQYIRDEESRGGIAVVVVASQTCSGSSCKRNTEIKRKKKGVEVEVRRKDRRERKRR